MPQINRLPTFMDSVQHPLAILGPDANSAPPQYTPPPSIDTRAAMAGPQQAFNAAYGGGPSTNATPASAPLGANPSVAAMAAAYANQMPAPTYGQLLAQGLTNDAGN